MYKIKAGNQEFEIEPKSKSYEGIINGENYKLDVSKEDNGFHILQDNKSFNVSIVSADYEAKSFEIMVNGNTYNLEAKDRFDLLLKELGMENLNASAVNDLKAPMPGLVLSIKVNVGDTVQKGDALLILEAMKMENVLKSSSEGRVKSINVETGVAVEKNQILIEFDS